MEDQHAYTVTDLLLRSECKWVGLLLVAVTVRGKQTDRHGLMGEEKQIKICGTRKQGTDRPTVG
jgi:hypothetical protein